MSYPTKNKPQKRKEQKKPKEPKKISPRYLRNSGIYYLQRFTASSGHFKTVMTRKIRKSCRFHTDQDFEECLKMLDDVTEEFIRDRLLDDDSYTRGMVTSLRRAGKSKRVIMGKLQQKSVPAKDIETALAQFDEENFEDPAEAEFLSALKLARKRKLGPYDTTGKYEHEKALAILARQGFSFDTSRRVLNLNSDDIYDLGYAFS